MAQQQLQWWFCCQVCRFFVIPVTFIMVFFQFRTILKFGSYSRYVTFLHALWYCLEEQKKNQGRVCFSPLVHWQSCFSFRPQTNIRTRKLFAARIQPLMILHIEFSFEWKTFLQLITQHPNLNIYCSKLILANSVVFEMVFFSSLGPF